MYLLPRIDEVEIVYLGIRALDGREAQAMSRRNGGEGLPLGYAGRRRKGGGMALEPAVVPNDPMLT